jgi:hypothetical protein
MLQLSCSWHLTKNLLASHQESLALSTRLLLHLLLLGISPKSLLASHQDFFNSLVLELGISPRSSWHLTKSLFTSFLTQEWVRPLALINLMREGEESSNLTVEIRSDGWLRFGVSSLTLTSIMKLSFNLHLTN